MKKQLKKANKKIAKYERELQEARETIEDLNAIANAYKKRYHKAQTALTDLRSAIKSGDALQWYERRVSDLEELISDRVDTKTIYGQMVAQNRLLAKEVRELRLAVYG